MKKIKGLVLESNQHHVILLTDSGEYRRLRTRGRRYAIGAEVEISPLPLPAKLPVLAAAALVMLVMALTLLWQAWPAQPTAYLALDINPSLLLLLNRDAVVLGTEPLNAEAETLVQRLKLKGLPAAAAIDMILEEAQTLGYLSAARENMVFLSLAAPQGYVMNAAALQQAATGQLISLEVDAYLKINDTTPQKARKARQQNASLNALLLAEEAGAGQLLPPSAPGEGKGAAEEGAITVQKLMQRGLPAPVFTEKDFIPGNSAARGQAPAQGRPGFAPPPQTGLTPPGRERDTLVFPEPRSAEDREAFFNNPRQKNDQQQQRGRKQGH